MSAVYYGVTAVDADTFEESVMSAPVGPLAEGTEAIPTTITWAAVTNARYYNIYRTLNSLYAFIGVAGGDLSFVDDGITADPAVQPPVVRDVLAGANSRPAVATYYQQRLIVASTNDEPEAVFATRTGLFDNFTISSPIRADDAVKWSMADVEVQEVRHLLGTLKLLMVFTGESVRRILGDDNGVLRPTAINPVQQSAWGASYVTPVVAGESVIYVESHGSMVRDLDFLLTAGGYVGRDLTIYAPHLFEGHTVVRAAYAKIPHSIWYGVRDDGVLLTLTYIREQDIWAWARHDTDGLYEDVMTLPEGNETAVYVVVNRTIGGATKRFIERFSPAAVSDIVRNADTAFLDSFLTYDGRNTGSRTMTLSASDWAFEAGAPALTLTASSAYFSAGEVGNVIVLHAGADAVRIRITAYTSTTVVSGLSETEVPVSLRDVAVTAWDRAVDVISGLDHLEGETVSILADGNVLAPQVVIDGTAHLGLCYAIVHAGLPYDSDFETLDLDVAGAQIRGNQKKINAIEVLVKNSRGFLAGPTVDDLNLWVPDWRENYADDPTMLITGPMEMNISATWNKSGRFVVRQSDPLPLTILAAIPTGEIGG